jgi:hypothetical protein
VPFTVVRKWALGRALSWSIADDSSCLSLDLLPAGDFLVGAALQASCGRSALLGALQASHDHACMCEARYLSFVSRDGVDVRLGAWLLLECESSQFAARVEEMAEVQLSSGCYVRLWCSDVTSLAKVVSDDDGMFRVQKVNGCNRLLVRLETVCITQLACCDRADHWEFRYTF